MKRLYLQKVVRYIIISLCSIATISMLAAAYCENYFMNTLPRYAIPSDGRIYTWNMHGAIVYMNKSEYILYYSIVSLFVGGFACAFIINLIFKVYSTDITIKR